MSIEIGVCLRACSTVTTWGSTKAQVLRLQEFLLQTQVTTVVMESTSNY